MEKRANPKPFLGKRVIVKLNSVNLRNIRGGGDENGDETVKPGRPPR